MDRIYISGKIGSKIIDLDTRVKFKNAAQALKESGFEVIDPTDQQTQSEIREYAIKEDLPFYDAALLYDLRMIADCDAIYMLSDWYTSPGSYTEFYFAKAIGKQIYFQT